MHALSKFIAVFAGVIAIGLWNWGIYRLVVDKRPNKLLFYWTTIALAVAFVSLAVAKYTK